MNLSLYKETECSCDICKSMCSRPCWGTPEEIQKIIDYGFGQRLMKDEWAGEEGHDIICPSLKTYERQAAPFYPRSREGCTFWKDGLCELHPLGLKPIEGRISDHKPLTYDHDGNEIEDNIHEDVAKSWRNENGIRLSEKWIDEFLLDEEDEPWVQEFDAIIRQMREMADFSQKISPD